MMWKYVHDIRPKNAFMLRPKNASDMMLKYVRRIHRGNRNTCSRLSMMRNHTVVPLRHETSPITTHREIENALVTRKPHPLLTPSNNAEHLLFHFSEQLQQHNVDTNSSPRLHKGHISRAIPVCQTIVTHRLHARKFILPRSLKGPGSSRYAKPPRSRIPYEMDLS